MTPLPPRATFAVLALGALLYGALVARPWPEPYECGPLLVLGKASASLRGEWLGDLPNNIIGFRAMVRREDPYPRLAPAYWKLGIPHEDDAFTSTHPPTTHLLVAPVALLPVQAAGAAWAHLMLLAIAGTWACLGAGRLAALGLAPLTLLWPPAGMALHQVTPLWMLALTAAWRLSRDGRPLAAGAAVGLASLTKLLPAVALLPYARSERRWAAVMGFVLVWAAAGLAVLALHPGAFQRYAEANANGVNWDAFALGATSAGVFNKAWRFLGLPGVILAGAFVAAVVARRARAFGPAAAPSTEAWRTAAWLAVALLPIAWVFSLLPLLPVVALGRRDAGPAALLLRAGFVALTFTAHPLEGWGARLLAGATVLLGASLLVERDVGSSTRVE